MSGMKDQLGDTPYGDLFGEPVPPRKSKPTAEELRDEGIERVIDHADDWFRRALSVVANLESGWTGIAEDIRHVIEGKLERPPHHNIWGGVTREAIKRGMITRTGRRRKMRDPQSHARMSDEYRRT